MAINNTPQLNMRRGNISPNKIANTGTNPYTGEYLSAGERKLIFKRNVSSANVFKKSGALVKTTPSAITSNVDTSSLSKRVSILENDVSFLAKALNKEADLEKKAQKQYEKDVGKVEEKKLRSGEEKKLEKKITKGLISPVKAVGKKAGGVLGNLVEVFMILLGGWLTNQGLEAIRANAEGNIGKLESIAEEVGKTLITVGGIFLLLNGGFAIIGGLIGALALKIGGFLWRRSLGRIFNPKIPKANVPNANIGGGARAVGAAGSSISQQAAESLGKTKIKTTVNAARTGGMASKLYDKLPAGVKRFNNLFQGGMRGSKQIPGLPRMSAPKPKGLAFKLGEMFGGLKNFAGKTKDFVIGGLKKVTDPLIKPLLGGAKALGNQIVGIASKIPGLNKFLKAQGINSVKNAKSVGKGGGILGSKALPFIGGLVNFMFAYDRMANGDLIGGGLEAISGLLDIGGLWPLSTALDAFLLARDFMPGIKENEEKLLGNLGLGKFVKSAEGITSKLPNLGDILNMVLGKKPEQPKAKVSPADTTPTPVTTPVPGEMPAGAMSAAQVSSPSSPSMSAPGPVSGGGNTTVIYKKVGGSGRQMQRQPSKGESATDVPLIASADPSNFYTMYSQLLYNVVG